jgi:hypothetical protein
MTASHVGTPASPPTPVGPDPGGRLPAPRRSPTASPARGEWSRSSRSRAGGRRFDRRPGTAGSRPPPPFLGAMPAPCRRSTRGEGEEVALVEAIRSQPKMEGPRSGLRPGARRRTRSARLGRAGPCGGPRLWIKRNILRKLAARGMSGTVFPARATAGRDRRRRPGTAFFLSNGPGDPAALLSCVGTSASSWRWGSPLRDRRATSSPGSRARGTDTPKLKFGHRG